VGSALRARLSESLGALADVFRTADLRRLGFAYLTSMVALWAYGIAISVYAFQVGGATLVGVAALIRLVPAAFVAPFAATVADRYPRRRVLLATDLVRAVLLAAACVAVAADAPAGLVFVIAGLNTVVSTVFEPAKNALLPSLVDQPEQLTAANTAMATFESSSIFLGPAIGGLALGFGSVQVALGLTGVLLLLSAAQISRIGASSATGTDDEAEGASEEGGVLAGFRAIAGDSRLRTLMGLLSAQLVTDGLLTVLTVSVAIDLLGRGDAWVGYLNSAIGVGGLLGAVATLALTGRRGLAGLFGVGLIGWGLPIALIAVLPFPLAALILLGALGIANTLVDSTGMTLLQRATPEELRGRVFGVLESVIIGSIALGMLLAPALIDIVGIKGALVASGALLPALTLIARPALARIDADVKPPTRRLELLQGVPMLAPLGPVPLEELATRLEALRFGAGAQIIREGEVGDRFYLIDSGEVEVFEGADLARRQGAGDFFGEIALLRDVPRTATVTAASDVEVFALEREDFLDAVTRDRLSTQAAETVIATRLNSVRWRRRREPSD
jgi:MFS family permease